MVICVTMSAGISRCRSAAVIANLVDHFLDKSAKERFDCLDDYCKHFSYSRITFDCSIRGALPDNLPDWLSRQLSTALFRADQNKTGTNADPRHAVCRWQAPSASDVVLRQRLFPADQGGGRQPSRLAQPFSIAVEQCNPQQDILVFSLLLFGYSAQWTLAVAELLAGQLITGQIIDGKQHGQRRFHLVIRDRRIVMQPAIRLPATPSSAKLQVLTSIVFRRNDRLLPFETLFTRLLEYQEGLAPWMGGRLKLSGAVEFLRLAEQCVQAQMQITRVTIRSKRIPVDGWSGEATIKPLLPGMWPLLLLGELTHVGSRSNEGLGRYRLIY